MNPTESTSQTEIAIRETVSALDRIHVSISPSSSPEKVREAVTKLAGHSVTVTRADKAVKFLMAQACMAVRTRKLYRVYGYRTFVQFIDTEVARPGLKRASAMKAISVVRAWPEESAGRLAQITERNLREAAQIVKRERLRPKQAGKLLDDAERMTIEEFAQAHGRQALRKGFAVIRVVTSKRFKHEFEQWLGDREPEEALKDLIRPRVHHRRAA